MADEVGEDLNPGMRKRIKQCIMEYFLQTWASRRWQNVTSIMSSSTRILVLSYVT
jgi:hypothetical protein